MIKATEQRRVTCRAARWLDVTVYYAFTRVEWPVLTCVGFEQLFLPVANRSPTWLWKGKMIFINKIGQREGTIDVTLSGHFPDREKHLAFWQACQSPTLRIESHDIQGSSTTATPTSSIWCWWVLCDVTAKRRSQCPKVATHSLTSEEQPHKFHVNLTEGTTLSWGEETSRSTGSSQYSFRLLATRIRTGHWDVSTTI